VAQCFGYHPAKNYDISLDKIILGRIFERPVVLLSIRYDSEGRS